MSLNPDLFKFFNLYGSRLYICSFIRCTACISPFKLCRHGLSAAMAAPGIRVISYHRLPCSQLTPFFRIFNWNSFKFAASGQWPDAGWGRIWPGCWPFECEWKVAISIITSRSARLEEMHLCRLSSDKTWLCPNKDQDAAGKAGIFTDHKLVTCTRARFWFSSWG